MTGQYHLGDLELAALISSRICHDVISPVGAISNGLEVLDEEKDEQVREYALDLIRRSAEQASAKLQFARLAFGAAGSSGAEIGVPMMQEVSQGILDPEKHKLEFAAAQASIAKDKVKLILNLFAIAITTLPRGGTIKINISGDTQSPSAQIRCAGEGARLPERLMEILGGTGSPELDSMSIQPYYAVRIAADAGMTVSAAQEGAEILLSAVPAS